MMRRLYPTNFALIFCAYKLGLSLLPTALCLMKPTWTHGHMRASYHVYD